MTNNQSVRRQTTAAFLVLAMQVGTWSAPWLHAHIADHENGHHDGRSLHAHVAGHDLSPTFRYGSCASPHASEVGVPRGEQPIRLQVFVAVQPHPVEPLAAASIVFDLPVPIVHAMETMAPVARSHGPPQRSSLATRAPPRSALS